MNSDDDTPLDSLLTKTKEPPTPPTPQRLTRWQKITDQVFAIKVQPTGLNDLSLANRTLLNDNLTYDEDKFFLNLTNVILVQLVEKPQDPEDDDDNKENEPLLENGDNGEIEEIDNTEVTPVLVDTEFEIDGITSIDEDNDFVIDNIGTDETEKPVSPETLNHSSQPENVDDSDDLEIVERTEAPVETFWYLEKSFVISSKVIPLSYRSPIDSNAPNLDLSVGGLFYKIYAEAQERRLASQVTIKPGFINHRRLYMAQERRNYPDPLSFMHATKEAYLEKMINSSIDLSWHTFCKDCFRCFPSGFDLQVHQELVHLSQHAATCRICDFNFGDPTLLLKHMASVHSQDVKSNGLVGAYRCQVCRFCSPLYSELARHFTEFHSRTGWLLCPLCLRCFSSDTTYEQHLAAHVSKGKFFRCQSCRLVFDSEPLRSRHEQEMHSRPKWTTLEPNPRVPEKIRVWVRGEIDNRSKLVDTDDLDNDQACRAVCLHDSTNPDNKSKVAKRKGRKGQVTLVPKHLVVAPKEFREEILVSKTRSQRATTEEGLNETVINLPEAPHREDTFLNRMSELYFLLGSDDEEDLGEESVDTSQQVEIADTRNVENFIPQRCLECLTIFNCEEEFWSHFTPTLLKHYRSDYQTHCPVAFRNKRETFMNGPSLNRYLTKPEWESLGKDLLKSYPKGVQCSCGKVDWDFGAPNVIAKHLVQYPSHSIKVPESAAHKESVQSKLHSQRIKRMIQGYNAGEGIERILEQTLTYEYITAQKDFDDHVVEDLPEVLAKLNNVFKIKKRTPRKRHDLLLNHIDRELHDELMIGASGVDFHSAITSQNAPIGSLPRKTERAMTSIFKKTNIERKQREQQKAHQKQLQLQQFQQQQQAREASAQQKRAPPIQPHFTAAKRQFPHTRVELISKPNTFGSRHGSGMIQTTVRSQVGQKRPSPMMAVPPQKRYGQTLPVPPADVNFPVVTHKEIQVEIIPSGDAKRHQNIDKYEIEFKGRKTPNKYNVKPNIKIVKLIGLQSDTVYQIKVFSVRYGIRSPPITRDVQTAVLPRGQVVQAATDVIELD